MENYKLIYYQEANGKYPVKEFIDNCNEKTKAKIFRAFMYISEFGLTPTIPHLKKLTGTSLWEIRILGKDNIRIILAHFKNNYFILLHAFFKKTQKTSSKDLSLASSRYSQLLSMPNRNVRFSAK